MIVKECRFMRVDDACDKSILNWSRCYEWKYCMDVLKANPQLKTISNAACGCSEIHQQFSEMLDTLPGRTVYNSDVAVSAINKEFSNFHVYDVLVPSERMYDCSLCISYLEDLCNYDAFKLALDNLLNQTSKRLIITCDYPGVKTEWLRDLLSLLPSHSFNLENALSGATSFYREPSLRHLNILLIDIIL